MKLRMTILASAAGAMVLGACTPQPYNPDAPHQNATTGVITGALAGALIGGATSEGDKNKMDHILGGAVIGGLAGGMVGSSLDKQARELAQEVGNSRIQIINEGDQLRVIMPDGILFATDSASVQQSIMNDLYAVADSLNRYPNTRVEVVGHTDSTGAAAYNQDLSEQRARAVAGVLRGAGVSAGRIVPYGQGENQPIASNLTEAGKAQNRRVEILIIPNQ